jgi:hypothetical protein
MTGDQLTAWKAALAAHHRQQRQQRGRVVRGTRYGPGMARIEPATAHDDDMQDASFGKLARCPAPGCAVRWTSGADRECADHQNEVITAARELGLLDSFGIPPPDADVSAGQGGTSASLETDLRRRTLFLLFYPRRFSTK